MRWMTLLKSNRVIRKLESNIPKLSESFTNKRNNLIEKPNRVIAQNHEMKSPIGESHIASSYLVKPNTKSIGKLPYVGGNGESGNERTTNRKDSDKEDPFVEGSSKPTIYDEFNKIKDPQQRYEYLLDKANTMDVSTEKNKAIFYSGKVETANGTITARQMAERYADQLFSEKGITKLTLERTPGGKWMDDLGLYKETANGISKYEELGLVRQQSDKIWHTLSSRYANDASGAITAFSKNVPDDWKPKTIFWKTELRQLRLNKNVTHINIR